MIGFLRLLGLINAAIWFGAAVFFVLGVEPASRSGSLRDLIGANNFPYYSVAIGNVFVIRFFQLHAACSVVAVLYLVSEWLYLGKYPPNRWLGFVLGLILLGLIRGFGLQPALKQWHDLAHGRATPVEQRQEAGGAFSRWAAVARGIDFLLAAGLAVYVWRVGNPPDTTRFVVPNKFRS